MRLIDVYQSKKEQLRNRNQYLVEDPYIPEFKLFNVAIREKKSNVDIDFEVSFLIDYQKKINEEVEQLGKILKSRMRKLQHLKGLINDRNYYQLMEEMNKVQVFIILY